jgi:hypothetical protein
MRSPSQTSFRIVTYMFALVLVGQAVWLLAAELIRPALPYFPATAAPSESDHARARMAASVGAVRGDLWADYAATFANALAAQLQGAAAAGSAKDNQEAFDAARRGARLAPHDARAWLILAAAGSGQGSRNRDIAGALKMSYYTAPGETALMPMRIRLATRSNLIEDDELQTLVVQDLRAMVQRPELKSDILAAYRQAAPAGKKFIEARLDQLDPALLRTSRDQR